MVQGLIYYILIFLLFTFSTGSVYCGQSVQNVKKTSDKQNKSGNVHFVSGNIYYNKKKMKFYDGAATWDKGKNELRIYLFPYKLSSKAMEYISRGKAWMIGMRRRKAKGKLEDYYLPAIQIIIYSKQEDLLLYKDAYLVKYMFFGVERINKMYVLTKEGEEMVEILKTLNLSKDFLSFHTQGKEKDGGALYKWDFNISVPIFKLEDNLGF
jgi:hypothetical protein